MKTAVYFTDPSAHARRSRLAKLSDLFDRSGAREIFRKGDNVCIKVHFGEEGNTSYLRPVYARFLVKKLKDLGTHPFLTDSNTLYRGSRHTTEDHLRTARHHGFTEENIGAPIIISDEFIEIKDSSIGPRPVRVARSAREADSLLIITHVTGHMVFGYAGAIKNVSMGLASPAGKQIMHSDLKPVVKEDKCIACGTCRDYCPVNAITQEGAEKARINHSICIGCGECSTVCPVSAIPIIWKGEAGLISNKSAAYARVVLAGKQDRVLFLNFLIDITPDCDCCDWSEPPIVPDQGILASRDIVAVDQASVDMVGTAPLLPGATAVSKSIQVSRKKIPSSVASQFTSLPRLKDKFKTLFNVEVEPFLKEAEAASLGTRQYEIKTVE